jgi:hypothetical protein
VTARGEGLDAQDRKDRAMRVLKFALFLAVPFFAGSLTSSADAKNNNTPRGHAYGHSKGGSSKGAPAPIAGAGLVGLGSAGAIFYWIVRRYRRDRGED